MKISLFGVTGVTLGKHNVKDPRLDQADKLVEADKKCYAQVELLPETDAADAHAILTSEEARADLILKDWEFVETRLARNPPESERALLVKLKDQLEKESLIFSLGLGPQENQAIAAYNFLTNRPVISASASEWQSVDMLLLRALKESGFISFLTVGGKENRAWLIRNGMTAWEAAGSVHSDLQRGFIRAEIIGFEDLIQAGGETQAKRAGKMRLEQKDYVMKDYDVTHFRCQR